MLIDKKIPREDGLSVSLLPLPLAEQSGLPGEHP